VEEWLGRLDDLVVLGRLGSFRRSGHSFFQRKYGFNKCLLTSSCTDALEMAAILLNIMPDDEVIMPSYTFVSTANPFVLRGAKIIFVDSMELNPNIDAAKIEALITTKTKAIVVVHYAGIACEIDKIMSVATKHGLYLVEDAAQAIDSFYTGADGIKRPLGSIGDLAAFSFHETKNIISGEGGMLVINNDRFINRSEIIWEKGTNRSAFFRGEVDKYGWVDIGSSFLPSEIVSAFLFAQLEHLDEIQEKRLLLWNEYYKQLKKLEDSLQLIKDKGAKLIAVTPEKNEYILKTIEKTKASYSILYDKEMKIMKAYAVAFEIDERTVSRYKNADIDLATANGQKDKVYLPVPAVYIINKEGTILYRYFDADYKKQAPVKDILGNLR